jgi:hypothetical protein
MTLDQQSELRLLQIRNAISEKERFTATANHELHQGGWKRDWNIAFDECDRLVQYLTMKLTRGE